MGKKNRKPGPDLGEWLHSLPATDLADIVESARSAIPEFREYVERIWTQAVLGDAAVCELAVERMPDEDWFLTDDSWRYQDDWDNDPAGYEYAEEVRSALAPLLSSAEERPRLDLLPLLERALEKVDAARSRLEYEDVYVDEVAQELADVLRVRMRAHRARPGRESCAHLRDLALDKGAWGTLREEAETLMASQSPTQWEVELLDQGRVDEAWRFGQGRTGLHGHGVWDRLLEARGATHPEDVLQHYKTLIDDSLADTGRSRYEAAGGRLVLLRRFADAAGQYDWFAAYLRNLWDGARRRPACREIFTRLGLVPEQGSLPRGGGRQEDLLAQPWPDRAV